MGKVIYSVIIGSCLLLAIDCFAQDKRTQYPGPLRSSYFGVNVGYIQYKFSALQLEPGYTAGSVRIPHTAVQVVFGHRFNRYLSAQLTYLRPVAFVEYKNINNDGVDYEVGMNVFGATIKPTWPVSPHLILTGEIGAAVLTRGGFIVINAPGVKDEVYIDLLSRIGVEYQLNKNWQLSLSGLWSPANNKYKQPATQFYSAGFNYIMQPLSAAKVKRNANSGHIFPRQMFQVGYTTNALGYNVNDFVSKDAHIFWAGAAQVKQGFSMNYQRNIFHGRKVFSLDWGAGLSYYISKLNQEKFFAISVYPVFRFNFVRLKSADIYFVYSFGGPSLISKAVIDEYQTGRQFTFQDFMGLGMFVGKTRKLNAEIKIAHYSNGNIFPQNNGVMIPLSFSLGYSF